MAINVLIPYSSRTWQHPTARPVLISRTNASEPMGTRVVAASADGRSCKDDRLVHARLWAA
jgi:hypothetical protein